MPVVDPGNVRGLVFAFSEKFVLVEVADVFEACFARAKRGFIS
jgi:hypothetical protein